MWETTEEKGLGVEGKPQFQLAFLELLRGSSSGKCVTVKFESVKRCANVCSTNG